MAPRAARQGSAATGASPLEREQGVQLVQPLAVAMVTGEGVPTPL